MPTPTVKRAFKYRFHPTGEQASELARTFGCVRKVHNLALAARTEARTRQERLNYAQTSAMPRPLPEGVEPTTVTGSIFWPPGWRCLPAERA